MKNISKDKLSAWLRELEKSFKFVGYTREASGHNPRDLERMRLASRDEDKLGPSGLSWPRFRCVGCGRCLEVCLAQMASLEVVRQLLSLVGKESIRD